MYFCGQAIFLLSARYFYMDENITQETPSTYFNNIIRRNLAPITIDELEPATIERFNGSRFSDVFNQGTARENAATKTTPLSTN